jgi:hypothetical protein
MIYIYCCFIELKLFNAYSDHYKAPWELIKKKNCIKYFCPFGAPFSAPEIYIYKTVSNFHVSGVWFEKHGQRNGDFNSTVQTGYLQCLNEFLTWLVPIM